MGILNRRIIKMLLFVSLLERDGTGTLAMIVRMASRVS